ncbi:Receptor-like serine/threonine-protein kinase ALE2 [Glycine soja]|uniref:Receptor-like serine/threonine-protein kinase ALE2 n=1 Tax=Glycine soja TaxID=3848 RepID=A0A0B2SCI5_GLYSO|nr:Receptor-like serine/threonine-protein kinase ALE2 [Glycine soja]
MGLQLIFLLIELHLDFCTQQVHEYAGPSVFKSQPPFSSPNIKDIHAPATAPSPATLPGQLDVPSPSPRISPLGSSLKKKKTPSPAYTLILPPPPPNKELAKEIATSVLLNHTQVRIVGADAANQQLEKITVLLDLVPKGVKFDDTSAILIYKKFWYREILIDASVFGAYEVLYVHSPGLPPSPPSTPSDASGIDDGPNPGHDNNGTIMKPLGVDVPKKKKEGNNGRLIVIFVLSSCYICCIHWSCLALSAEMPHLCS